MKWNQIHFMLILVSNICANTWLCARFYSITGNIYSGYTNGYLASSYSYANLTNPNIYFHAYFVNRTAYLVVLIKRFEICNDHNTTKYCTSFNCLEPRDLELLVSLTVCVCVFEKVPRSINQTCDVIMTTIIIKQK